MPVLQPGFKELAAKLDALPELRRMLFSICVLAGEPLARTIMLLVLNNLGARNQNGNLLRANDIDPELEALIALDLLAKKFNERSEEFYAPGQYVAAGVQHALAQPYGEKVLEKIRKELPADYSGYKRANIPKRYQREVRVGLYRHDFDHVDKYYQEGAARYPKEFQSFDPYQEIFNSPFDAEFLRTFPPRVQMAALEGFIWEGLLKMEPITPYLEELRVHLATPSAETDELVRSTLINAALAQGELQAALQVLPQKANLLDFDTQRATIAFLQGENDRALQLFEAALKELRRGSNRRQAFFRNFAGIFYPLALLKAQTGEALNKLHALLQAVHNQTGPNVQACRLFEIPLFLLQNNMEKVNPLVERLRPEDDHAFMLLLKTLVSFWVSPAKAKKFLPQAQTFYEKAKANGYDWYALEFAALLARSLPREGDYAATCEALQKKLGVAPLASLIAKEEEWQRVLKAVRMLSSDNKPQAQAGVLHDTRLAWFIDFNYNRIQPREQKLAKDGLWTKGRNVALTRLRRGELSFMTPQDHEVARTIKTEWRYYGNEIHFFETAKALKALVGHPLLFNEAPPHAPVELVKGEPELTVRKKKNDFEVEFSCDVSTAGVVLQEETPARYRLIEVNETHKKIATAFGAKKFLVPEKGREQLSEALTSLSAVVTVHSELEGVGEQLQSVAGDGRIHCHLTPVGDGFNLSFFVRPFKDGGPYFKPGKGGSRVIAELHGKKVQAERDLKAEKKNASAVIASCPALDEGDQEAYTWMFDDPHDCLEALSDLQALGEQIILAWPEGQGLRISHQASFQQLVMGIRRDRDWFAVTGELVLDEALQFKIQDLLELLDRHPGRFIPLDENRFLALTEEFRRRLDEIRVFSIRDKSGVRFHQTAGLLWQQLTEDMENLKADEYWQEQKQRIEKSLNRKTALPSTFKGELREYQLEGFQWLAQLANWGVGACLADDMGLGKTIQALVLLLARAKSGPALVIAPASVILNWQNEAVRFAPTLNAQVLGAGDRAARVKDLGPRDLLICSYGLLHQEAELLQSVAWETIVLDEAQAIKNAFTKRSQAAMRLNGAFKFITTGTPIENHLGELWNLFHFLNPGLLGSLQQFNENYAAPIEKYKDLTRRKQLKRLLQPFILRRTKAEVLEELPPKTEITLTVDLSDEEKALYEALRLRALDNLAQMDAKPGERYLKILAEIMRLRRACCHPKLVMAEKEIAGSKLALFKEVVEELRENNHKALVFSQFVDHLTIIRAAVEEMGIAYQYLDGSTPVPERQRRVNAFQAGEGELFLISLRAGGLGLNLTAADYVIHMDPWWNPAVEDQASDRAHRIGQQHPVTIYRLIAKGTIEEKILALHKEKRNLADGLLDETGASAKLPVEELMKLILET
ncbi:ATP-dependent helicase [candidate division KSB1 bacterium]|nr:ATP-dependent helicase [candidate division KSB1 bacterium]